MRIEWQIEVNGGSRKDAEEQMRMRPCRQFDAFVKERSREMDGCRYARAKVDCGMREDIGNRQSTRQQDQLDPAARRQRHRVKARRAAMERID
jgi:hypothetical protein